MKKIFFIASFILLCLYSRAQSDSTIDLHELKISSSKLSKYSSGLKQCTFDSTAIASNENSSLSSLLNENSSAFIKNYGPNQLSMISLRGGSAYHTAVLWNGFSIANPMHGLTDLSIGKNFFFDDINLQYGGTSSIWGSGAVSGTIHLDNKPSFNSGLKINAGIVAGSFSDFNEFGSISIGTNKIFSSLKFFNENNKNNFLFYNTYTGANEEQIHSSVNQYGLLSENYFSLGVHSTLNIGFWHSFSDRQVPPTLLQVNSMANQKDIYSRFTAELKKSHSNNEFIIRSAYFDEKIFYNNDFLILPSNNRSKTFINEASYEKKILAVHILKFGINHTYSKADASADLTNASESRLAAFFSYSYHSKNNKLNLSFGSRKEFSSLNSSPFIFSGGIDYLVLKDILFRLSASNVYRNPTLNDLYWNPGGNSNLKPENGYSTEAGFKIYPLDLSGFRSTHPSSNIIFDYTFFYKKIDNWIIWYPSSTANWEPNNISVISKGMEITAQYSFSKKDFSAGCDFNFSYTISTNEKTFLTNDASLHCQLIYVPVYRSNLKFYVQYMDYSLNYNHSYTGYRYTTTDNSEYLEPFYIDNVMIARTFIHHSDQVRIFIRVNNLFNTDYQSVKDRPMPLRSYETGITFSFIKNKNSK